MASGQMCDGAPCGYPHCLVKTARGGKACWLVVDGRPEPNLVFGAPARADVHGVEFPICGHTQSCRSYLEVSNDSDAWHAARERIYCDRHNSHAKHHGLTPNGSHIYWVTT